MGSALWVMHLDGSDQTQLTTCRRRRRARQRARAIDDYHAYWSPDGRHVEWAHLNWNFVDGGGQGKWDVRVATFVVPPREPIPTEHPHRPAGQRPLVRDAVVDPPDGSGFLYTETYPARPGAATTRSSSSAELIKHDSACTASRG